MAPHPRSGDALPHGSSSHNAHAPYLYVTARGRVFRCACCDRVQVEFADLVLPMDRSYFEKLDGCLREAACGNPDDRWVRLQLHTDAGVVNVPLRPREVRQFHGLVSGAHAMLRLRDYVRSAAEEDVPRRG